MSKIVITQPVEILIKDYLELGSSYKVAAKYGVSATAVKRLLKEAKVLRTQSDAARQRDRDNSSLGRYTRTDEHRKILSECAKNKTGDKNPFFNKTHSKESKALIGAHTQLRTGKRNPNYKHGKTVRRPRDFKLGEFAPIKNSVFNRDKHTCLYCSQVGNHLHAHHIIPYWVCPTAFLDESNLITVCNKCHFEKAHKGNWHHFDVSLVTDSLILKYSLNRERLNELALFELKRDAIV